MIAAIYSRKSVLTEKGESIDNQIQLCKEYAINHLKINEFIIYEDEGYSGKNTSRPEFQRMMQDLKKKKFNTLMCYRLDRISRNVADFSNTLESLTKNDVSFVSIKEQFDTSSPMGRAMVYISSVFAQLERETIAERVKDNMLELSKTGRYLGGRTMLGFDIERIVENGKQVSYLVHNEPQMEIVKIIYQKYLEKRSVYQVLNHLTEQNIGFQYRDWSIDRISKILRSPYYVITNNNVKQYLEANGSLVVGEMNGNGMLIYNQKIAGNKSRDKKEWIYSVSRHKGVISAEDWLKVQNMMDKRYRFGYFKVTSYHSYLTGLIRCSTCGKTLTVKYGVPIKGSNDRYMYYGCLSAGTARSCKNGYIGKQLLEDTVLGYLNKLSVDEELLKSELKINEDKNNDSKKNEIKKARKQISKNDTEIQTLIKQMSNFSSEVSGYISDELNRLSLENAELKKQLSMLENSQEELDIKELNKKISYNNIKNFKKSWENCTTIEEQRFLLSSIVKKITVDLKLKEVQIELLE